jgi:putative Mn2+ efflux pump MntP
MLHEMWNRLAAALLFGLAANMDNVSIGFAYGVKGRRIGWWSNLLIAIITTGITLTALTAGMAIRRTLPPKLPDLMGGSLLLVLAAWYFWADRGSTVSAPLDSQQPLPSLSRVGILESLILAMTLSINNIGLAIAGGIGGIGYEAAAVSIGGFSIATLAVGQCLGSGAIRRKLWWAARSGLTGNIILVLAGLLMLAGV